MIVKIQHTHHCYAFTSLSFSLLSFLLIFFHLFGIFVNAVFFLLVFIYILFFLYFLQILLSGKKLQIAFDLSVRIIQVKKSLICQCINNIDKNLQI